MKAIVLYKSKYGAAKKYAEWLSGELNCGLTETQNARIDEIEKYDTIILGGGIYAGGIAGLSFFKKNFARLKGKKLVAFAVGASPYDEKAAADMKAHNFKDDIADIPCFYCRGAWNESAMSFMDRTLCGMLKKVISKKDPATLESWQKELIEAMGSDNDWTDKTNLLPLLEYVRTL